MVNNITFLILAVICLLPKLSYADKNIAIENFCTSDEARVERLFLEKHQYEIFTKKVLIQDPFKILICQNFQIENKQLLYNVDYTRSCSADQINELISFFYSAKTCNPSVYVEDIEDEYYNLCTSQFQEALKNELHKSRKDEIQVLFNQSKESVLGLLKSNVMLTYGSAYLENVRNKLNMIKIDYDSQLFRSASGVDQVWDESSNQSEVQTVIQLRRKSFASDLLILGTLAHEWGHFLDKYFPYHFQTLIPQLLKQFKNSNNTQEQKRREELSADLWAGYLVSYALSSETNKNQNFKKYSKVKYQKNFCQLESSEKNIDLYYQKKDLEYLHPVHRATITWELGFQHFHQ